MGEVAHSAHAALPPLSFDANEAAELRVAFAAELPTIPTRFLYDDAGSDLFERITELPEYYQTRTELAILEQHVDAIIDRARPTHLAELGSGAGRKIGLLVQAMLAGDGCERLTLFDINASFLQASVETLRGRYPNVDVDGIVGRFNLDLHQFGAGGRRMIAFFGSTIGNFHPDETVGFLRRLAAITGPGDSLLIGVDQVKDIARLEAAYNDSEGVTAEFNLNILRGFNRAVGTNYDPDRFEHVAFYDADNAWIEMRLRATAPSVVTLPALGLERVFEVGDEVRTEISCKYTPESVAHYAAAAGLRVDGWYTDPEALFALVLLRKEPRQ